MLAEDLYAAPRAVSSAADCYFYHVMEVPGLGVTTGEWDLRKNVADYLGRLPLQGKRVLEIGPASGFLTFEMEKRGAEVVAVEVPDDPGWEFVPYPPESMAPIYPVRHEHMRRLKNSFWYAHAAHRSQAKVHYGDVYNLPPELGHFDIALMASVLLHTRSPVRIMEQCARLADTLVIVERVYQSLEAQPLSRLSPTAFNHRWDSWWEFGSNFFIQFCQVMGFNQIESFTHRQGFIHGRRKMFTVVASRGGTPSRAPRLAPTMIGRVGRALRNLILRQ
jgi:SAM-dependent methyltransferase